MEEKGERVRWSSRRLLVAKVSRSGIFTSIRRRLSASSSFIRAMLPRQRTPQLQSPHLRHPLLTSNEVVCCGEQNKYDAIAMRRTTADIVEFHGGTSRRQYRALWLSALPHAPSLLVLIAWQRRRDRVDVVESEGARKWRDSVREHGVVLCRDVAYTSMD
ncbi:hypothetical protein C8J57DRAFT_1288170 [Mycena rebaudengoi]|nr:hypothetical protein C8J57DRAFT_1288170 [Mycena rebaudengoi]